MSEETGKKPVELSDMQLDEVSGGGSTYDGITCSQWDDVETFKYYNILDHKDYSHQCPKFERKPGEPWMNFCQNCNYFS